MTKRVYYKNYKRPSVVYKDQYGEFIKIQAKTLHLHKLPRADYRLAEAEPSVSSKSARAPSKPKNEFVETRVMTPTDVIAVRVLRFAEFLKYHLTKGYWANNRFEDDRHIFSIYSSSRTTRETSSTSSAHLSPPVFSRTAPLMRSGVTSQTVPDINRHVISHPFFSWILDIDCHVSRSHCQHQEDARPDPT